jgi:hypothetical protein
LLVVQVQVVKNNAGAGGAGGYLTNYSVSTISLTSGEVYTVTVGAGGASQSQLLSTNGNAGSNSVLSGTGISTVTAIGGGYGGQAGVSARWFWRFRRW